MAVVGSSAVLRDVGKDTLVLNILRAVGNISYSVSADNILRERKVKEGGRERGREGGREGGKERRMERGRERGRKRRREGRKAEVEGIYRREMK